MRVGYAVYIDESGDEGFVFKPDGSGSSRWLVLSAVVIRKSDDLMMVDCIKQVRELLGKPPKYSLHFVDLKHEQRIPYTRRIGMLPIKTISVLIYKPIIGEPDDFKEGKFLLYLHACRLLLARISSLCRGLNQECSREGLADIIFSNRSNMSYHDLRNSVHQLIKDSEVDPEMQVDGSIIYPDRIRSIEHSKLAGLQVADAVASSINFAVKKNRYGEVEPAYAPLLANTFYRHQNTAIGYGLKFWPGTFDTIIKEVPEAKSLGDL